MRFSILHPTARPDQWRKTYDAWIAAAAHPENIQYVLAVDNRWGFGATAEGITEQRTAALNDLRSWKFADFPGSREIEWNTTPYKHSGYVSSVNLAAKVATGDVLIVIADDLLPAHSWDVLLSTFLLTYAPVPNEFVIWVSTGTPQEFERRIMPMPILSRSRFERLGYVFYPKYESMYADNDFCEHAEYDQQMKVAAVLKAEGFMFEHRHPFFEQEQKFDAVYKAQNAKELYDSGKELLEARREARFTDVLEVPFARRRIWLVTLGENFPGRWMDAWTELVGQWSAKHDLIGSRMYSTQVYLARVMAARSVLQSDNPPDYVLWIDDDNPPFPKLMDQLVQDLEAHPQIGLVAGWTKTALGFLSFGVIKDGVYIDADEVAFLKDPPPLQRCDWTGFPIVLMRYDVLKAVGFEAFLPMRGGADPPAGMEDHRGFGFLGEDIGFCEHVREKGFEIWVDRRVKLEHLKVVNINP